MSSGETNPDSLRENARIAPNRTDADSIDVPEWAQCYDIGDKIAFDDPNTGKVLTAVVIGFSTVGDCGLPVVSTPDEIEEAPVRSPDRLRLPEQVHVPPEEVEEDA